MWKDTERQNEKLRLTWREGKTFLPKDHITNKQTNKQPT